MGAALAPPAREHGWLRLLLALVAFVVVTKLFWAVVPVMEVQLLLVPAVAACFIAGWLAGGSLIQAVVWTVLAAVQVVLNGRGATPGYLDLARGWGLLVGGAFGVVNVLAARRNFLTRALAAIALALACSLALAAAGRLSLSSAEGVFNAEFEQRNREYSSAVKESIQELSERFPNVGSALDSAMNEGRDRPRQVSAVAAPLFPAMLGLEGLVACAIAWGLYHRLSRSRLGPPLAPLREFRFNDQLVWGFAAGLVLWVLPSFDRLSAVGANLLVFFGGLFVVRGLGVIAWWWGKAGKASRVISGMVFVVATVLWPVATVWLLTLGLGDTWTDWRGLSKREAAAQHADGNN